MSEFVTENVIVTLPCGSSITAFSQAASSSADHYYHPSFSYCFVFFVSDSIASEINHVIFIPIINGETHAHWRVNEERTAIVRLVTIPERNVLRKSAFAPTWSFSSSRSTMMSCVGLSIGPDGIHIEDGRRAAIRLIVETRSMPCVAPV